MELPCAAGGLCADGSVCDLVKYEFRTDVEIALFNLISHGSVWRPQFGTRPILDIPAVLEQIKLLPLEIPKSDRLLYLRAIDAGMASAFAQSQNAEDTKHKIPTQNRKS